jgi:hypothetical protein
MRDKVRTFWTKTNFRSELRRGVDRQPRGLYSHRTQRDDCSIPCLSSPEEREHQIRVVGNIQQHLVHFREERGGSVAICGGVIRISTRHNRMGLQYTYISASLAKHI